MRFFERLEPAHRTSTSMKLSSFDVSTRLVNKVRYVMLLPATAPPLMVNFTAKPVVPENASASEIAELSNSEHDQICLQDMNYFVELLYKLMDLNAFRSMLALQCPPRYGMSCWRGSRRITKSKTSPDGLKACFWRTAFSRGSGKWSITCGLWERTTVTLE